MESSGRNTHDEWRVVEVVAAITIVTGIAAIIAMRDKTLIVMTGVLGGMVLGLIAWQAFRRNNKDIAKTMAIVAAVVLLATTAYGVFVDTSEAPKPIPPTSTKKPPAYRGSAKLAAGQWR